MTRAHGMALALLLAPAWAAAQPAPAAPGIADNSFLIEEAYNQEPGVYPAHQRLRALQ